MKGFYKNRFQVSQLVTTGSGLHPAVVTGIDKPTGKCVINHCLLVAPAKLSRVRCADCVNWAVTTHDTETETNIPLCGTCLTIYKDN